MLMTNQHIEPVPERGCGLDGAGLASRRPLGEAGQLTGVFPVYLATGTGQDCVAFREPRHKGNQEQEHRG